MLIENSGFRGVLWVLCLAILAPVFAEDWEGPKLKPVTREESFEFDVKPTVKNTAKDVYEISFSVKAKCDVSVVVEDKDGNVIRHIVSGVLGSNAPEPFKKDSLSQTIIWDGKNDRKKYVDAPEAHTVRVSLGLNPTFDRLLSWHPKDAGGQSRFGGIVADKDGVYVLNLGYYGRYQLRAYDHDGNYKRTLSPFAADKFNTPELKAPTRTVEDGRVVPILIGRGTLAPVTLSNLGVIGTGGGKIALFTSGYREQRTLLRLRTDGSSGGEPMVGQVVRSGLSSLSGSMFVAMSHDGKWVYLSGLGSGVYADHPSAPQIENTIWRFAWDAEGPIIDKSNPWQGEKTRDVAAGAGSGSDDKHLNHPEGIAVDESGKVYVCDTGNNRIQVFSPEGIILETIPFKDPHRIGVNHKTGEIYVLSVKAEKGLAQTVTKLGKDRKPGQTLVDLFTPKQTEDVHPSPMICVDSWSDPVKIWTIGLSGNIQIHADRGGKFEKIDDFEKDVRDAGVQPRVLPNSFNRVSVDPVRGHLWVYSNGLYRCDPNGNGFFEPVKLPMGQEIAFGLDGHLYMRDLTLLSRMNPSKMVKNANGVYEFEADAEVPFEYGEEYKFQFGGGFLRGAVRIPALPGANCFDNGFCVAPNGDIYSYVKNYQSWEGLNAGTNRFATYIDNSQKNGLMKELSEAYRPKIFPGRNYTGAELIFCWNARGELLEEDILPALPMASNGVRADAAGNIYVGIGISQITEKGPHIGGALAKFAPKGGRFYGMGDSIKLDKKPDRPAEYVGDYWTRNMFWSYPGFDRTVGAFGTNYDCLCSNARFDTDLFGRSFIPKAYAFTVGVVDTNGNTICEVGRYGNADSGRGPDSPVKIGGPEIALAHCSYLATHSDRWLYLVDDGNRRIVRVKLGYHADEKLVVPVTVKP